MRRRLFAVASAISLLSGCSLPSRQQDAPPGSPVVKQEIWECSTASGDKPGTGLRLRVSDTEVTGTFYLLDLNRPNDFAAAGQVVPLADLRKKGRSFTFMVVLQAAGGAYREQLSLSLDRELKGAIGDTVAGQLRSTDGPSEAVDVLLVRRE